jgi:hypothetical protein
MTTLDVRSGQLHGSLALTLRLLHDHPASYFYFSPKNAADHLLIPQTVQSPMRVVLSPI